MLFLLFTITCNELVSSVQTGLATISFEEGPSIYTQQIAKILNQNGVKATFYLDPEKINEKTLIKDMIEKGHTIGLAINNDFNKNVNLETHLKNQKNEFAKKTGYVPKFVRLPRILHERNYLMDTENNNLIITKPNLDSEDDKYPDYIERLEYKIINSILPSISIVLRDRIKTNLWYLYDVIQILRSKYRLVGMDEYYGVNSNMNEFSKEQNSTSFTTENGVDQQYISIEEEMNKEIIKETIKMFLKLLTLNENHIRNKKMILNPFIKNYIIQILSNPRKYMNRLYLKRLKKQLETQNLPIFQYEYIKRIPKNSTNNTTTQDTQSTIKKESIKKKYKDDYTDNYYKNNARVEKKSNLSKINHREKQINKGKKRVRFGNHVNIIVSS